MIRCEAGVATYPEHVLAVAVQDACARLQVLAAQELGEGDCDGVRGTRHDGLRLARRVLVGVGVLMPVLVLMLAWLTLLLLLLLLVLLLCLHPLPLDVFCRC
jgi:hypothetical protein